MYNQQAINIICNGLKNKGIEFESNITTNGFYLTPEISSMAVKEWHLKKVQITLDGTETIYNRIKAYIDAEENPYQRVLNNIDKALEVGISVMIRMNMDANNAEDLSALIDELAERFSNKKDLIAYVVPLKGFVGKIHNFDSDEQSINVYSQLTNKLRDLGILRKTNLLRGLTLNSCMADNDSCEVLLPDGRTGRCQHFSEQIITGDIFSTERDEKVTKAWKERYITKECSDCVLYPTCVKLKMCEWNKEGCPVSRRQLTINEMKKQILAAYRIVKEGGSIDETEEELYTDWTW